MSNIYIVGFMGTGKTSAGREAARRKNWQFVDLDELIELKEKAAIARIFAKKGEPYFRKAEKRALKEAAAQKNLMVACGGGIVIDKDNINIMKKTGVIVCLKASPEVILKRTCLYAHRPLLNVANPKKQIELLLKLRAPYYAQADRTIDTSEISVKEAADRIIKVISKSKKC
ncbi:MAG: shikimate kinase [Candidatus Omnitrophota bacterium]